MRRLFVFGSLAFMVLVMGSSALATLSKGERKTLRKNLAVYLDPGQDNESRAKAMEWMARLFDRKPKELADVKQLVEIVRGAADRNRVRHRNGALNPGVLDPAMHGMKELKVKFPYLVSVPKKYRAGVNDRAWPLILCINDQGQTAQDYLDTHWADPEIRARYLIACLEFSYDDIEVKKEETVKEGDVVRLVEKKEKRPFAWETEPARAQFWFTFWKLMIREYKVDPDRVILDGQGRGATGALTFASGATWRFAGLIVRGGDWSAPTIDNFSHIPVLLLPGEKTGEAGKKTMEALKKALAETKNVTEMAAGDPAKLLAWLDGCVRERHPVPSRWVQTWPPGEDRSQLGYWCMIKGRYDRDRPAEISIGPKQEGKIEITAKNVREFTLFVNDLLVDLGRRFDVVVNGEKVRTVKLERSLDEFLRHGFCFEGGKPPYDMGCVFTGEVRDIQVPPPPKEEKKPDEGKKEEGSKKEGEKPEAGKKEEKKPEGAKPGEQKPGEQKPAEQKPGEQKPGEQKPAGEGGGKKDEGAGKAPSAGD